MGETAATIRRVAEGSIFWKLAQKLLVRLDIEVRRSKDSRVIFTIVGVSVGWLKGLYRCPLTRLSEGQSLVKEGCLEALP